MDSRKSVYTIVGIIVAAGLLLSVVLGAVAGGAAGYFVGRREARAIAQEQSDVASGSERYIPEQVVPWGGMPGVPQGTPSWRFPSQSETPGALVTKVTPDTPAEKAGLQAGDIILAVNDEKITLAMDLAQIVQKYKPGDTITLTIIRDGAEQSVQIVLGQHPDNADRPYIGVTYTSATPSLDSGR